MKTVKVRIPILIDYKGNWVTCEFVGPEKDEVIADFLNKNVFCDKLSKRNHIVWVEADVPLPSKNTTVKGFVV